MSSFSSPLLSIDSLDLTEAPVQKEEPVVVKAVPSGPGTTLGAPSGKILSFDQLDNRLFS